MIAFTKDMPFGGRAAFIQTSMFHCGVSTAKDGIFKPRVTMITADAVAVGEGRISGRPVTKFIYSKSLRSADYLTMHDAIVKGLNEMGQGGVSLPQAVASVADTLKKTGAVTECLNLLNDEEPSLAEYAEHVQKHTEDTVSGVGLALCVYLMPIYKQKYGADNGAKLAAAVGNLLMLRAASADEGRAFDEQNVTLINSLVADLAKVPQIRKPMSIVIHTAMNIAGGTSTVTAQHIAAAVRLSSIGFLVPVESLTLPNKPDDLQAIAENFANWLREQPQPTPIPDRPHLTPKVAACLRMVETELLKRSLSNTEEGKAAELCGALLQKALGEERLVVRLIRLEWPESVDVVDAFRRAQSRWEKDHNRFG